MSPADVTTTEPDAETLSVRRQLLTDRRHAEAATVIELEQQVSELEAEAHDRLVAGDLATYDAGEVQLSRLRPQLDAARARTSALDAALQEVHRAEQHAQWEAELHAVTQTVQDSMRVVAEQLDERLPGAIAELRTVLREAESADNAARFARERADQLRVQLGRQDRPNRSAGGQSRYREVVQSTPELSYFTGVGR